MKSKIEINTNVTNLHNNNNRIIVSISPSLPKKNYIYLSKNNNKYKKINKILLRSYTKHIPVKLILKPYYLSNKIKIVNAYKIGTSRIHIGHLKHVSTCIIDNKSYTEVYFKNQPENKIFVTNEKKKDFIYYNCIHTIHTYKIKYKHYKENYYNISSIKIHKY